MNKMIKLSLVAAAAVASFSTTASAQALTDAIQGVEVSGSVEYRMEHRSVETGGTDGASTNGENAKLVVAGKTKVNDMLSFATKAVGNGQASSQGDSTGSTQATMNVNVAKFIYTSGSTNVIAGMQELATPWTDAGDGARANGILATVGMGGATIAAAHFRNSQMGIDAHANLNSANLTALAVLGSAGPVGYQAWYLNISDQGNNAAATSAIPKGGDALAVLLNGKFGPVTANASYASLEGEDSSLKKQTLAKLILSANAGIVKLTAGYVNGGKDGNLVTFDPDAKAGFQAWNIRAGKGDQADLTAITIAAEAPVGPVSLKLQYTDAEYDTAAVAAGAATSAVGVVGGVAGVIVTPGSAAVAAAKVDVNEILAQVTYKMSKNFTTYLRYAQVDMDSAAVAGATTETKTDRVRLSLKYTF